LVQWGEYPVHLLTLSHAKRIKITTLPHHLEHLTAF
jgi:hypothetical protein